MNKTELQEEVKIYHKYEAQYKEKIFKLRREMNEIKERLKELKKLKEIYNPQDNITDGMIFIEKRIAEHEQYSRRESVELAGPPDNKNDGELEETVL